MYSQVDKPWNDAQQSLASLESNKINDSYQKDKQALGYSTNLQYSDVIYEQTRIFLVYLILRMESMINPFTHLEVELFLVFISDTLSCAFHFADIQSNRSGVRQHRKRKLGTDENNFRELKQSVPKEH